MAARDGAPIKGPTRHKASARRRRLRHALTWDGITDQQILDRDRWRCHICRKKINPRWCYPDQRSKSIDHVVPLAEGGDDTAANKRAAHLDCNMSRGDRGGGEQLALLGWYEPTPIDPAHAGAARPPRPRPGPPCTACGTRLKAGRCWTCEPARPKLGPRPESVDRGREAARLRAEGWKWQAIADHLAIENPGAVYYLAKRYGDLADVAVWLQTA